jgi:hypothetical protein
MRVTCGFEDAAGAPTEVSVRVEGDAGRLYRLGDPSCMAGQRMAK